MHFSAGRKPIELFADARWPVEATHCMQSRTLRLLTRFCDARLFCMFKKWNVFAVVDNVFPLKISRPSYYYTSLRLYAISSLKVESRTRGRKGNEQVPSRSDCTLLKSLTMWCLFKNSAISKGVLPFLVLIV